tara:strand:+ start:191 stop:553 length:363 start_codon:yes stop_codon:yes gene_type:complete
MNMTVINMNLDTIYFNFIKNGQKIYETRIFDDKRKEIKLKDIIIFKERGTKKSFKTEVIELSHFSNFRDAIQDCGLKKVMPNAHSIDKAVELYESFPHDLGTYKVAAKKLGVLRFMIRLL